MRRCRLRTSSSGVSVRLCSRTSRNSSAQSRRPAPEDTDGEASNPGPEIDADTNAPAAAVTHRSPTRNATAPQQHRNADNDVATKAPAAAVTHHSATRAAAAPNAQEGCNLAHFQETILFLAFLFLLELLNKVYLP